VGLFLATSLFGRLWCGYTCPQTVWTDLFMWVEQWVEGDRNERMQRDAGSVDADVIWKKVFKALDLAWDRVLDRRARSYYVRCPDRNAIEF
jgi:polyferredoxin